MIICFIASLIISLFDIIICFITISDVFICMLHYRFHHIFFFMLYYYFISNIILPWIMNVSTIFNAVIILLLMFFLISTVIVNPFLQYIALCNRNLRLDARPLVCRELTLAARPATWPPAIISRRMISIRV